MRTPARSSMRAGGGVGREEGGEEAVGLFGGACLNIEVGEEMGKVGCPVGCAAWRVSARGMASSYLPSDGFEGDELGGEGLVVGVGGEGGGEEGFGFGGGGGRKEVGESGGGGGVVGGGDEGAAIGLLGCGGVFGGLSEFGCHEGVVGGLGREFQGREKLVAGCVGVRLEVEAGEGAVGSGAEG